MEKHMQNIIPRFNKKSLLKMSQQFPAGPSFFAAAMPHKRILVRDFTDTLTRQKPQKQKTNNASELHRANHARATVAILANR